MFELHPLSQLHFIMAQRKVYIYRFLCETRSVHVDTPAELIGRNKLISL